MAKFTLNLDGPLLKLPSSITANSFDYVSRYQLIAEIITRYFKGQKPNQILDVGGLGTFLGKVLDTPLTILDEEATDQKNEAKGDGARMNVADGAYDIVITSDTLEHIPPKDRQKFISELVRVSSDLVILCAPFGDNGAAKEEAKVQNYYKGLTGHEHRWLKEHADFGIPHTKEIKKYFDATGINNVVFGHSSIKLWREMMGMNLVANDMGHPETQKRLAAINQFYNQNLMFNDFTDDSYRMFFVASKKQQLAVSLPASNMSQDKWLEFVALINDFYEAALTEAEYVPKLRARVQGLHDEKMGLASELDKTRQEFERTLHSRSWRYSAPIRKAEKIVKKAKS